MASVKFGPSKSEKVLASFSVLVDELPGLEIGGGYIGGTAEKPTVNLNPPFARGAGLMAESKVLDDGEDIAIVPSKAGKVAAEHLKTRIKDLWTSNKGAFDTFGI